MCSSSLPVFEVYSYFFLWTSAIFYSLYQVYLASNLFDHSSAGDDFSNTWFGRYKDITDYEWTNFIPFILYSLSPWIVIHIVVTEFTRWMLVEAVPASHALITSLFVLKHNGPIILFFYIATLTFYFILLRLRSRILIWSFGVPFLLLSSFVFLELSDYLNFNDEAHLMLVVSNGWLQLRCISFCLDVLNSSDHSPKAGLRDLYAMLGYSFYFPLFFLGPFIIYDDFKSSMSLPFEPWSRQRIFSLATNLIRYFFWLFITDLSLFFFYAHALQYHMREVEKLGAWTLNGIGYFLGQFFCNKYIVVYGLLGTVAQAERYPAPPVPKCIARIHLYSEMWRSFDVGYYSFLLKYMYKPLCGIKRDMLHRLFASFVCFAFVFIWHGVQLSVFIWSLLNFLGISLEATGRMISNSQTYQSWQDRTLSPSNVCRLKALISSPLFAMSAVSNFYFFGGMEVGNVFLKQFYKGSWSTLLTIWFFSYCMSHVSMYVEEREIAQQRFKGNRLKEQ